MSNDEVLKLAKQARVYEELCGEHFIYEFAKLVAAQRTEEIARHCIWLNDEAGYADGYDFANAIRVKFQNE